MRRDDDAEHLESLTRPPYKPSIIRCEHGHHHHAGPHACDWGNHGNECVYNAAVPAD